MATRQPIPSGSSSSGLSAEQLSGKLLAIYVDKLETDLTTKFGTADAVDIWCAEIGSDGTVNELGETRLFSTVLVDVWGTLVGAWTAGRIIKPAGKRYWCLADPEAHENVMVDKVMAALPDRPRLAETIIGEAFPDEPPF
jgi:hypothetical protein